MSRPKGFKHTEETKRKLREHHKGFQRSHTEAEKTKIGETMREWHRIHRNPRKGKTHSEQTRQEMSLTRQGSKNANWKGGLTKLIRGIRRSPEYYQWRKAVLERDNYTCRDCKSIGEVEVHHIQSILDKPELIFEVNNGLTLCGDCHHRHTFWQKIKWG